MNPKILSQGAGERGLLFTELRKAGARGGGQPYVGLEPALHLGQMKFQVLIQMQKAKGFGMCNLTLEREVQLETYVGSQHKDGIESHEADKLGPSPEGLRVWEGGHDKPAEEPGKGWPRNQKEAMSVQRCPS